MATAMIVRFGTHFQIRLGEWLASIILCSVGVLLATAPTMFDRNPIYFHGMTNFALQPTWATLFLTCGIVRIVALYVNGRKPITPYIRMAFAFVSCFVWYQTCISLFASGVPGLGWAVFPWLTALDMYNVFRSSADAREVFDKRRALRHGTGETD